MRATVIPADRWIRCDDDSANLVDWPFDDANIHAIQWYETEGEVEYIGKPKPQNTLFTDVADIQPYVAALAAHLSNSANNAPTEQDQ